MADLGDHHANGLKLQVLSSTKRSDLPTDRNVFIGVSIGTKSLTTGIAKQCLLYGLGRSRHHVLVLIADSIEAVNWMVFREIPSTEARQKVRNKGRQFDDMFARATRQIAHDMGRDQAERIHIVRWDQILSENYRGMYHRVAAEFEANASFRDRVLSLVDWHTRKRSAVLADDNRRELSEYVLAELPTLLGGVEFDGQVYNLLVYPTPSPTLEKSGLVALLADIGAGLYPNLRNVGGSNSGVVLVEAVFANQPKPRRPQ